ncbi:hypothetical protein E4S40_03790 [Algoriphagus kandeliae]|uniref:Uncharacterized protein n=1 Tax=Algoriphagus kandeliae TaxID=2562278 RepID=A0A4Y9QZ01_9BACT|nr:hypothetical protein [Algoriphagus kandeliae]TFV97771.1 hypothetical protein E4S40_03790 [Algoriphagus kandeliae]
MDLGNIIYILAIIAYFIYQVTKGNKKAEEQENPPKEGIPTPEKGVTFEDLLREIRDAQRGTSTPKTIEKPKPKPQFEPVRSQKAERTVYKPLEENDDEIQYYKGAFENIDPKKVKTSEGIPDIPKTEVERFDQYASKSKANPYAQLLKNKSSVKQAIVLKEILDRKYF